MQKCTRVTIFLHLPFLTSAASRPTEAALSISLIVVMVRDDDELQLNQSTTDDIFPERVSLSALVQISPWSHSFSPVGYFPKVRFHVNV